jgi:hypothetical protein
LAVELRRGRHAELVGELFVLTAQHPLRERLWSLLIRALNGSGRRADALDAYHTVRRQLADELGIDPSDELQRLYTRVLVGRAQPSMLPPVPRQLPLNVSAFTGRAGELARLDGLLPGRAARTVVSVITGTRGIGKTALALHWAHRMVDHFPDGQLWMNLNGHDPHMAVQHGLALQRFLRALGVPGRAIPLDVDDRIGLYRSLMDGRRMLVVLDNAVSSQQVRPLLPGAPGSIVLVTSRRRLSGLVADEGALPLGLGLLSRAEAGRLLAARLGGDRIAANSGGVDEIVRLCGGLPRTLTQVAARAATYPQLDLHAIAADFSHHLVYTRRPVPDRTQTPVPPPTPEPKVIGV